MDVNGRRDPSSLRSVGMTRMGTGTPSATGLTALLCKPKGSVVASNAHPRCPSFQRGTVFYLLSHCVTVAFSESWLHLL